MNTAGYLKSQNIKAGDSLLLISENSFFSAIAYLGTMANGSVIVPLHPRTNATTLEYAQSNLNIKGIFSQKKYLKKFSSLSNFNIRIIDKKPLEETEAGLLNLFDLQYSNEDVIKDMNLKKDLATILFTSGSTGTPKGVMLSHQNLKINTTSIIEYLNLQKTDRVMIVLPYSYCYGASWLHTLVRVGGTNIINNRFLFPNKILKEINDKKCSGFAGVPSHFQILLRKSNLKTINLPSLRFIAQAGGKLSNVFIKELQEVLPKTRIFIMYGQTEATARLSYLPPNLLNKKLGSIGKGIPGVTLKVLDKRGFPIKVGEIGEIVASGENIMLGYWNDIKESSKMLRNGQLWTGDLATIDDEGYIYIVDREKQIIKSGGHRISPKEIESYILQIPEIIECAVIGIADEILGEVPKAFVVLKEQNLWNKITQEYIINYCKKSLPSYKLPKKVQFLKTLPKNNSNKILVNELKEM